MGWFQIPIKKGEYFSCDMEEVWEQVLSRPLRCGQKFKRTVRRKTGVLQEQREDLEATIKGSFGIKGLAQLESAIQAGTGASIKFEEYKEVEETIEVAAPEYGRYVLCYFQKKQLFNFEGRDSKYFRGNPLYLTVQRWVDEYRDESRRYEVDPACGGPGDPLPPPDGILDIVMEGGKLTIATPYRIKENGIEFDGLGLRADVDLLDIMSSRTRLPLKALPEATRQLTGIRHKQVDAIVMQSVGSVGAGEPSQYEFCFPSAFEVSKHLVPSLPPGGIDNEYVISKKQLITPMEVTSSFPQTFAKKFYKTFKVPDIKRMWSAIEGLPLVSMKSIMKK